LAIKQVTVVSVPVSDQDRARAFYVDKLGFELIREDASIPGFRWVQVAPKGAATSLTLVNWFDSMPAGSLQGLVFVADDLRAECERLAADGAEFEQLPEERPYGLEAVLRDPDGNRLVLQQG